MAAHDVSGPNAAYVAQLLEDFEDSPASIPDEWRQIFEARENGEPGAGNRRERRRRRARRPPRRHLRSRRRRPRRHPTAVALPRPRSRLLSPRRRPSTRTGACRRRSRRRWRSSRRTACTATSRRGSTRSAPPRQATRRSTRRGSSRRSRRSCRRGSRPGSCASPCPGPPCSRRCRASARSTRARAPTRSSTSPTTRSGSGSARRSSRAAFERRSSRRSASRSCAASPRSRASSSTSGARSSARSSSRSRGSTSSSRCSTRRSALAAEGGAHEVVIGMAHRGRLNALVHTVGRSYESVLREFEGERSYDALVVDPEGGSGDVKYHLPASGTRRTAAGEIEVTISPEPEPPRGRRSGRRGLDAGRADRSLRRRRAPRSDGRAARPHPRRRSLRGPGSRRRDVQPAEPPGLRDGRHAAPDHEQPGRLHDEPDRGPFDEVLERPRQGIRRADRARQRRRPGGRAQRDPARARLPGRVRARLRDRPRRLPALRAPGAGRRVLHAAADGRADPGAAHGARALRSAARRGGRDRRRGGTAERRRGGRHPPRGPRPAARLVRRSRRAPPPEPQRTSATTGDAVETAVARRPAPRAERAAARGSRGVHDQPQAGASSSSAAARRSRAAGSTGARPKRSRSPRCSRTGSRFASPARTPSAGTFAHRHLVLHDPGSGETVAPMQHLPGAERVLRGLQLTALRVRGARVRVRLLGLRSRRARPLGGAVRRLRERRPDRDRPVHRRRPLEVEPDVAPHAPAAARLRGQRPRALEREARAVPPARRAGQHPGRQLHDRGAVLPPAPPPGARRRRAAARRDVAEGPAAAQAGVVDARRPRRPARSARCSTTRPRSRTPSSVSCSAPGSSTSTSAATS